MRQSLTFFKIEDSIPKNQNPMSRLKTQDSGHGAEALSFEAQDMLYESVFVRGAEGECGGLMTQEERMKWKEQGQSGKYTVDSCFGNNWHVEGTEKMPLSDMGFHGRHHIALKDSSECQAMLKSMQALAPSCSAT